MKSNLKRQSRNLIGKSTIEEIKLKNNVIILLFIILIQISNQFQTLNKIIEISNDENSGLLMNFSNNYFNASSNKNISLKDFNKTEREKMNNKKNIKEIKINLNSKEKNKINYKENQFLEKIIYIQKWWKIIYKIILLYIF